VISNRSPLAYDRAMTANRLLATLSLAFLLAAGGFVPAGAARAQSVPDGLVSAALLPGWQTAEGRYMSALRVRLAPGWKTYWRSPGEAGIPPLFDWTGSDNVAAVQIHWPRPQVFLLSGYRTLAYPDELLLPVEVTPARPGDPVTLRLSADIGICEEICVPVTIRTDVALTAGGTAESAIAQALRQVPPDARAQGLPAARCVAEPIRDGMRLTATIPYPTAAPDSFAIVELKDRAVWVAPVETRLENGSMVQVSDLVPGDAKPFALSRGAVRLTVFSGTDVVEFSGCKG
jgi:DsbC/DsbD-like thiol-disulfide interchange protein